MDGGFPYGDVIVIAAIAAFILLRYRAMLGEPRGRDDTNPSPIVVAKRESVVSLASERAPQKSSEPAIDAATYGSLADTFVSMRSIDREFLPTEFLTGARTAYEMVIEAFSKRQYETLKMLLSSELYANFEKTLKTSEEEGRFNDTTLVAILTANISKAVLAGTQATLTVAFESEQIHLVRDAEGAILEGNPSAQQHVNDEWVFTRDLANPSPNWTIVET